MISRGRQNRVTSKDDQERGQPWRLCDKSGKYEYWLHVVRSLKHCDKSFATIENLSIQTVDVSGSER